MKKVLLILIALAGAYYVLYELDPAAGFSSPASSIDAPATKADAMRMVWP
jgi:hypothetical protein